VAYIKYISLAGSYQAWRKRLHFVKKLQLTLGSESDDEERIVGSETLSKSSRELSDSYVPWQKKKKKRKTEKVNESAE